MYPGETLLQIEHFTVHPDRIACEIKLGFETPHYTTPELIARIGETFPDIAHHACVNDEGETFAAVMDHTALPHLLEHLVISLQVRAAAQAREQENQDASMTSGSYSDFVFVGTTEWIDEAAGRARVEVSFIDDLMALRAFREAIAFLSDVLLL